MASEVIKLNLIPSGEMPTFHCSQFDNGREIKIELYNGEDAYTLPTGYTAELHTRKMDNNIVTLSSTSVVSNLVTFTSTEQLTSCAGNNLSEVSIKDASDYVVGTLNFWLYVEKDPLCGGLTSTSSIHDLTDQIEEITTEIVGENYYNKSETDDLLDLKADKATTYTKTETDTLLTAKADKTSVYTKTETNSLLAEKADADDVYTKSQVETKLAVKANAADVYTKSETDALLAEKADISDLATVATTGDYDDLLNKPSIPAAQVQSDYSQADNTQIDYIKNKPDIDAMIADALLAVMPVETASGPIATFDTELAVPLVNVSSNIVATGGNGTPDSPNPINGYTEANITANGDVITISFGQTVYGGQLIILPDRTYIHVTNVGVVYDGSNDENWGLQSINSYNIANFFIKLDKVWTQAELSLCDRFPIQSTLIANTTTEGYLMSVPDTLYLRVNSSRASTTAELKTWLASKNVKLVYKIDTPFDIDLTPVQIWALVGENNVHSDTNGNTTVKFKDSIQHYIDTHTGG